MSVKGYNILIALVFVLASCKINKIQYFSKSMLPVPFNVLIIDSFILLEHPNGIYNTGRISKVHGSDPDIIVYDSVPFNNAIAKIEYSKTGSIDSGTVRIQFTNIVLGLFACNIKDQGIRIRKDTGFLVNRNGLKNQIILKFYFVNMVYVGSIDSKTFKRNDNLDSNVVFLSLDTLMLNSNNVISVDCSELYLYYGFNGIRNNLLKTGVDLTYRNKLILTSPYWEFDRFRKAFTKEDNCGNSKCKMQEL